jgi:hypothetical protein
MSSIRHLQDHLKPEELFRLSLVTIWEAFRGVRGAIILSLPFITQSPPFSLLPMRFSFLKHLSTVYQTHDTNSGKCTERRPIPALTSCHSGMETPQGHCHTRGSSKVLGVPPLPVQVILDPLPQDTLEQSILDHVAIFTSVPRGHVKCNKH